MGRDIRINIEELQDKLQQAHDHGYDAYVIINGEVYSINYKGGDKR